MERAILQNVSRRDDVVLHPWYRYVAIMHVYQDLFLPKCKKINYRLLKEPLVCFYTKPHIAELGRELTSCHFVMHF